MLASGGGTNLQALIDSFNGDPAAPARVSLVVAGRAGIGALDRAAAAGIDTLVLDGRGDADHPARLLYALEAHRVEIVVLAGYLQLVPQEVVERYRGRMVNIHPALLPTFGGSGMYGMRVHRAVIEAGARVSGATVHLVGERYDEGAILAQWPVPVLRTDTPETLAARVLAVEHLLLPAAVEELAMRLGAAAGADPVADPPVQISFELSDGAGPRLESVRYLVRQTLP